MPADRALLLSRARQLRVGNDQLHIGDHRTITLTIALQQSADDVLDDRELPAVQTFASGESTWIDVSPLSVTWVPDSDQPDTTELQLRWRPGLVCALTVALNIMSQ